MVFANLLKLFLKYYNALDEAVATGDAVDDVRVDRVHYVFNCQQDHLFF